MYDTPVGADLRVCPRQRQSTFTDPRDGKVYKTVKIGKQIWMAENLNYNAKGSKCYKNDPANAEKYGRLYDWKTAMKACPKGWHLPTDAEWDDLVRYIKSSIKSSKDTESPSLSRIAGKHLKAKKGWHVYKGKSGNGTDKFGFSALPGGYVWYSDGSFHKAGKISNWWSATEGRTHPKTRAYFRGIEHSSIFYGSCFKSFLLSVRCIQDSIKNAPKAARTSPNNRRFI